MYIVFIIILAIIFVLVPILDKINFLDKIFSSIDKTRNIRHLDYYVTIAYLWVLIIPVFIMCIIGGISLADIGFRRLSFNHNIWFTVIVIIIAFVLVSYEFVLPLVRIRKTREQILNSTQEDIDEYPQTSLEKLLYLLQVISYALCEETIYRGFLLFLLYTIFPEIPLYLIGVIAFISFGIGHLYQGLRNAIQIGLFGVLSMGLLIVTGSLIPSILLHFFGELVPAFIIKQKHINQT